VETIYPFKDKLFIGGRWVAPHGRETIEVHNAGNGEVMGRIPAGDAADADAAVKAARSAFDSWSHSSPASRAEFLEKISAGLKARADELARTIAQEVGMPLKMSSRIQAGLPIANGFPAYVPDARAFVMTIGPTRAWQPGVDGSGEGTALNVRALSQVCPHLGCRPNPCVEDFWFHCPCHQSRYDRLGVKPAGSQFGPADRSMDRFAIEVDADGVLTVDTSRVKLGPLPVVLGQPGVIPPKVAHGCGG
jgi:Rieske Fe-S protein